MNLTDNFTLAELTSSSFASRHGINNVPADHEVLANLHVLARGLERVREAVGRPVIVTSGYRSPKVNAGIGGSKTSAHMRGLAADIKVQGMTALELANEIAVHRREIDYDQLIEEFGAWVHIAFADAESDPRGQVLTARRGSIGVEYIKGLA
jgi:hypothetical protein